MRNWNRTSRGVLAQDHRFQTTYEELKPYSSELFMREVNSASRLPMRNWNQRAVPRHPQDRELPDYLWGIETLKNVAIADPDQLRFQTTYEELKLHSIDRLSESWSLPDYLWGIETEANHASHKKTKYRFQTTYEELKPDRCSKLFRSIPASRLPMRNWNEHCGLLDYLPLSASRLPMRNWNVYFKTENKPMTWLPDYLWGIETSSGHIRTACGSASRLPMRNWNFSGNSRSTLLTSFQTTYEELKHGCCVMVSLA